MKRQLAALLCTVMITAVLSPALAAESDTQMEISLAEEYITIIEDGECGDNLTWELDSSGVLTIRGGGAMKDYSNSTLSLVGSKCKQVTSVVIEAGVTSIGNRAFNGCTNLTDVQIPNTVEAIGEYAFYNCSALEQISIPASVKRIGSYAFLYCDKLASIRYAGTKQQWNAVSLGTDCIGDAVTIVYSDGSGSAGSSGGSSGGSDGNSESSGGSSGSSGGTEGGQAAEQGSCGANVKWTLDDQGTLTIYGSGAMEDNPAEWIGKRSSFRKVVVEDGVASIGTYAFADCANLTEVSLASSVSEIEYQAFYRCTVLQTVSMSGVTKIGDSAFFGCTALKRISLPSSLTSIGTQAFSDSGLMLVHIPDSVTEVGEQAFAQCVDLEIVILSNKMKAIPKEMLYQCYSLRTISMGKGVETIAARACSECTALENLTVSDSVKTIGSSAFEKDTDLKLVDLGDGVTAIGDSAFAGCLSLQTIEIPDSVETLGAKVFRSCAELEYVRLGDAVREISDEAFSGCTALKSVTMPDTVTTIGATVFSGCSLLQDIRLSGGLTSIGSGAFQFCRAITSIEIPESVRLIDAGAFTYCTSLSSMVIRSRDCVLNAIGLSDTCELSGYIGSTAQEYAKNNKLSFLVLDPENCQHSYEMTATEKEPTCTKKGSASYLCTVCGDAKTEALPALGHTVVVDKAVKATTTKNGKKAGSHCSVCKEVLVAQTTIYKVNKIKLSKTSYKYNGKTHKPTVSIYNSKGKKIASKNYTVKYSSGCKKVGTYTVTVTFVGDRYKGKLSAKFKIKK
ncbi:MAG: leucine-rich repeat domain-containing protein [Butyricicoccus sp.]